MTRTKTFSLLLLPVVLTLTLGAIYASHRFCTPAQAACGESKTIPAEVKVSTMIAPQYYTYTDLAVTQALGAGHQVVLYFWAPWCTSCASLDIEIENNPEIIPDNVLVLQIPYDTAHELRTTYGVTTQHTFVEIDATQAAIQTWVGGDVDELTSRLTN